MSFSFSALLKMYSMKKHIQEVNPCETDRSARYERGLTIPDGNYDVCGSGVIESRSASHVCLECSTCIKSDCKVCNVNNVSVKMLHYKVFIISFICIVALGVGLLIATDLL